MSVAQADIPAAVLRDFGIVRYEYNGTSFCMKFLEQDKYLERCTCVKVSGTFFPKKAGSYFVSLEKATRTITGLESCDCW